MIRKTSAELTHTIMRSYRTIRPAYTIISQDLKDQRRFIERLVSESTNWIIVATCKPFERNCDEEDLSFFDESGIKMAVRMVDKENQRCNFLGVDRQQTVIFQLPDNCTKKFFDQLMGVIKKMLRDRFCQVTMSFTFIVNQSSTQKMGGSNDNNSFRQSFYYELIEPNEFKLMTDGHSETEKWALRNIEDFRYTFGLADVFKGMFYCDI
jgi:hypothetical protein